jgi:hypothetical protein
MLIIPPKRQHSSPSHISSLNDSQVAHQLALLRRQVINWQDEEEEEYGKEQETLGSARLYKSNQLAHIFTQFNDTRGACATPSR